MLRRFLSLLRCNHRTTSGRDAWMYPVRGVELCSVCGASRPAAVQFPVDPRFDIPRYEPTAQPATGLARHGMEEAREIQELERMMGARR